MTEQHPSCPHGMVVPKVIGLLLVCATIAGSFYFLSKTGIYVKDATNQQLPDNLISNTISVDGEGKILVEPDILLLELHMLQEADTTAKAQEAVNKNIAEIRTVLKNYGVEDQDIQTIAVSIRPEYDRKEQGRVFRAYVAEQTLRVKIQDINKENKDKAALIIDDVAELKGIEINNIAYDIKDKTPFYSEARKLAIGKAMQKAKEIAAAASVELDKPLSINESQPYYYQPYGPVMRQANVAEMAMDSSAPSGSIAGGQLELSITISMVYGIK